MTREDQAGIRTEGPLDRTELRFRKAVAMATSGAALIALAGLLAYLPGLRLLGSIRPEYVPMAPATAGCFLVFTAALFSQLRKPLPRRRLAAVSALLCLGTLFCILELAEPLVGFDLNFDDNLIPASDKVGSIPVGQMSPATAITFALAGLGLLLLFYRDRSPRYARGLATWAASLGTCTTLIGATVLLAYLYGTPFMYGGGTIPMAATTALAFLFLGVALVAATGPGSFPMCRVTGGSTSALLSRAFLPLVLASIVFQSILSRMVSASPALNEALILAAQVVVMAVITAWVVERVASSTGGDIDEMSGKLREALKEKQESEEHHRAILRTAMDGIWLVDTQGRLLEANDAYCRMSGYSARELLAMKISDLESVQTAAGTAARIDNAMRRGEDRFESRHRRKDGTVFDVEIAI